MSTLTPFCNMGVITMKMISSTSITSTMRGHVDVRNSPRRFVRFLAIYFFPRDDLLDEIVNQLRRGVIHLDVERFDLGGEVVVNPHGRDGHEQTESGGDEGFGNTACDGRQTGGLRCRQLPWNAWMMPSTVPNRPTKGAVEPMVARVETPRFSSACTMAAARSRARLEASMVSPGISADT